MKTLHPNFTAIRTCTGIWSFRSKLLCFATSLINDAPYHLRRSQVHTLESNWSVAVQGRRENAIGCIFSRQGRRKRCIENLTISLRDALSRKNGRHRGIEQNIWSWYRSLDIVFHNHGCFRPTRSPPHNSSTDPSSLINWMLKRSYRQSTGNTTHRLPLLLPAHTSIIIQLFCWSQTLQT